MHKPAIDPRTCILEYRSGLQAVLDGLAVDDIHEAIAYFHEAYDQGRQVFIVGNGGSAATASHMACDLAKSVLGRAGEANARRFKAIALTDNMPLVTAWGNDASYEHVFAEQLRNLANPGDLLVVITASGNSPNVVAAAKVASQLDLRSIGLLGFDGGVVRGLLDHAIVVASDNYGYVEDAHMILNHLITDYFKQVIGSGAGLLERAVAQA
ncbi:MAG: SIS domain-containing protein [Kouleothrix sp.]|nr:SIS domain-containing protein [Kouleothrix sp.]